jgi:protein-histidine N-methyltransferase
MSFSFGFSGDDIDADDEDESLSKDLAKCSIADKPPPFPAKRHDLKDLVSFGCN